MDNKIQIDVNITFTTTNILHSQMTKPVSILQIDVKDVTEVVFVIRSMEIIESVIRVTPIIYN